MGDFIARLIRRHLGSEGVVNPRLPGRFETRTPAVTSELSPVVEETDNHASAAFSPSPLTQNDSSPREDYPRFRESVFHVDPKNRFTGEDFQGVPDEFPSGKEPGIRQLAKPFDSDSGSRRLFQNKRTEEERTELSEVAGKEKVSRSFTGHSEKELNADQVTPATVRSETRSGNPEKAIQLPLTGNSDYPQKNGGALGVSPGAAVYPYREERNTRVTRSPEIPAQPVIRITIGQIHVRAVTPLPSPPVQKPKVNAKPMLSLEDYLHQRNKKQL